MKSILVTGGAGFIGSHLVDALVLQYPDYRIISIDDYSHGEDCNQNSQAEYINLDISSSQLSDVFEQYRPEFVCHFAAQVDLRVSVKDPLFDAQTNLFGSINLLENVRKFGVKKIVFASSGGAVYSGDVMPADECTLPVPISPYGIHKYAIDLYLNYYHQVWGMQYVSLRYANVYGPRQKGGVIPIFIKKFLAGEQPVQNGDGSQTRDYVYVKDAVNACILALQNDKNGVYTVGTGIETSLQEVVHIIKDIGKFNIDVIVGPEKEGEVMKSVLKNNAIMGDFGWKVQYSLEEGIRETIDYWKEK